MKVKCQICDYKTDHPNPEDIGTVRGNTERFKSQEFTLWKCPECLTIHSLDPIDLKDIYSDYALNKRRLDTFAQGTFANLLRRLKHSGLKKKDKILDFGCGNGIFVDYLNSVGYENVTGYDPYHPDYITFPSNNAPFDYIINNDTIEHCEDVDELMQECDNLLKPGGTLYLGTADSEPVDMQNLEPHIMRLHQPFHRIIFTQQTLENLSRKYNFEILNSYRRSYHDTLRPFSNYRFLDELNRAADHDMDRVFDPKETERIVVSSPKLWFFAFFGYFFPSAYEPAVILRKIG